MTKQRDDLAIDRVLYSGHGMHVGSFSLPAYHPQFTDTGPISGNLLVFPRSSVTITHAGQPTVHADCNVIMLYNRGQEYRRGLVDPRGDYCTYFHFDQALLQQVIQTFDPGVDQRPQHPFRWTHAPCSPNTYLLQHAIVSFLKTQPYDAVLPTTWEPEGIQEMLYALLESSLRGVPAIETRQPATAVKKQQTRRHHREQVQAVLAHLYLNFNQPDSLEEIAAIVDLSPFHLSRMFVDQTGLTIHAYRNQLRLRRSLELLESSQIDVTRLAVQLGYASHSHFGQAFRRNFGLPPSQIARSQTQHYLLHLRHRTKDNN